MNNTFFFGFQKPFCSFVLDAFPKIRLLISNEYGNISHETESNPESQEPNLNNASSVYSFPKKNLKQVKGDSQSIVPFVPIDIPD